jgi:cellulose synthase operon protein YhjQ
MSDVDQVNEGNADQKAPLEPDDVATLYSWANLQGAKYRDFSESRQEVRERARHRIAAEQVAAAGETGQEPKAAVDQKPPTGLNLRPAPPTVTQDPSKEVSVNQGFTTNDHPNSDSNAHADINQVGTGAAADLVREEPIVARTQRPLATPVEAVPAQTGAHRNHRTASLIQFGRPADPVPAQEPDIEGTEDRSPLVYQGNEQAISGQTAKTDTLHESPERGASRWFALKGVFDHTNEGVAQLVRPRDTSIPALVVFSLAGGVGKTSLVATLGRTLASRGERVLLVDTTSYGLLPLYFGARDLRPGVKRTFSGGATDAPIQVVAIDPDTRNQGDQRWLADEVMREAKGVNRILIDLATASGSIASKILRLAPTVLVPVVPDMSSVVSLQAVDAFFRTHDDGDGHTSQPFYVLNRFDASLPLHLDVREVLRERLGDRLLPFALRRSAAVSEALAEGMTVVDYAPNTPINDDYANLSNWIRSISVPASGGFRGVRWSER